MLWFFATILVGVPIGVYLILKFVDGNQDYWKDHGIYYVRGSDIAPLWKRLQFKLPIHSIDKLYYDKFKAGGAKVGGQVGLRHPVLYILDPDTIRHILIKDFDHFVNRKVFQFGKDALFDEMLINKENQEWKDLRTTMSPTFTTGKIRRMFGIFNQSGNKMSKFLKQEIQGPSGSEVEMRDVCGRFTMDVIASSAFGVDSQNFKDKNSVFSQMGRLFQDNFKGFFLFKIVFLILFPKIAKLFKFTFFDQRCIDFFTQILQDSIKHRETTGEKRDDFLQLMLEAKAGNLKSEPAAEALDSFEKDAMLTESTDDKKTKAIITDETILAQATLFFLAGFDVMETLIMFASYELSLNPNYQERLAQEIESAVEKNGGELSYDIINQLEYLEKIISETLRKYPAAVRGERRCNLDYKIPNSDVTITKGTHVVIPIYGIHHDPDNYPEPDRFDPERFSAENKASRHSCTYIPFGAGPRNCIAMRFALMEGKTAIAHLVHNFKIQPCSKTTIPMEYSSKGFLKPVNGMWLSLTERK